MPCAHNYYLASVERRKDRFMTLLEISEIGHGDVHIHVVKPQSETLPPNTNASIGLGTGDVRIHVVAQQTASSAETTTGTSILELISKFVTAILGMFEVLEAAPAMLTLVCTVIL